MQILGFQKTTLLDFPGHVACTVFTGGCNFRCPFCHNGDLVLCASELPQISEDEVISHLNKRRALLEGVCITGGEPTLQPDLTDFIKKLRSMGFLIKLDTNGYQPQLLEALLCGGLVDYVAMDIKHCPEKYNFIAQARDFDIGKIRASVSILMDGAVPCEFRTTVVNELHKKEDFAAIGDWLCGASAYFLQPYQESGQVLHKGFSSYSYAEMKDITTILLPFIPNTAIRGMDEAY